MTKISRIKSAEKLPASNPVSLVEKKGAEITSAIKVNESGSEYVVYVAVPGMERKDFSLTIDKKMLTVAAVKKEAVHCFSLFDEQTFPEWKESFILPEDADTVMTAAVYRNGELEIHIPKGKNHNEGKPVDVFIY
ncbi:MAG: Hsp20/alpha crystallin family protein [Chitinophagaceae bacterium]